MILFNLDLIVAIVPKDVRQHFDLCEMLSGLKRKEKKKKLDTKNVGYF